MNEPARVRIVTILVTQLRELGINASLAIQEVGTWSADLQNGNTGLFMDFAYSGATGSMPCSTPTISAPATPTSTATQRSMNC